MGRELLPPRRESETFELRLRRSDGALTVFVGVGRYPSGALGEVSVDWGPRGERLTAYQAWARTVSVGLQYGVPLEELVTGESCALEEGARVECDAAPWLHGSRVRSVFGAIRALLVGLELARVGDGPRRSVLLAELRRESAKGDEHGEGDEAASARGGAGGAR